MYSLTAETIKDYQTCPRLFDYRHQEHLYEPVDMRQAAVDRFEDTMKHVVTFFFYKKQGGNVPSYSALLNRWERLWFPKGTSAEDIMSEQHSGFYKNNASYTTEASAALLNFYETFSEDEGEPFLIDEKFVVPFTKEIKLEGSFDLVLRYRPKKTFIMFKWSARGKKPAISNLEIDFSVLKYAFDYKTESMDNYTKLYGLYDLTSSNPGFEQVLSTKADQSALKFWANSIIEDKVYPPRRGLTPYCKSCPFDKHCTDWNGWDGKKD